MKKLILFLIITLVSITIVLGQAINLEVQRPQSFRSQALGGTVDDDLDLVYDPIELRFVSGIRLYTNLSNLTSYHEEMLNNYYELMGWDIETGIPLSSTLESLGISYANKQLDKLR